MAIEKIPCIYCTFTLLDYIKPYLEKCGYKIRYPLNFQYNPILIINYNNKLVEIGDASPTDIKMHNRELVQDIEEFLERAAKLKGFTYKRKDMETVFDINKLEVGMIVEYGSGDKRLVLSDAKGKFLAGIDKYNLDIEYIRDFTKIRKVYKILYPSPLNALLNTLNDNLTIIWEKPRETELTMQEIADKFGIPVEQLKIKK